MCRRTMQLVFAALALGAILIGPAQAALIAHWPLDESSGTVAKDVSGNGNDGTVGGTPNWVAGHIGGALDFDGATDFIHVAKEIRGTMSVALWAMPRNLPYSSGYRNFMASDSWAGAPNSSVHAHLRNTTSLVNFDTNGATDVSSTTALVSNQWYHIAWTYNTATGEAKIYINGVLETTATGSPGDVVLGPMTIGARTSNQRWFNGIMDDIRVYNHVLSAQEVQQIMKPVPPGKAGAPRPEDGARDVPRDVVLRWTPGPFAAAHNVYFGTSLADVNAAGATNPLGVLASAGQDANTFDPAGQLEFGRTYYWRVDEVNAAPDATVFKGPAWSFTVEPYAYPLTNITATASSSHNADMGPQKTVDGSGLDAAGLHGTTDNTMWLSSATAAKPAWIQYEFDRIYKVYEMWVWNANQSVEATVGFGARDVTIEYSTDMSTWTALGAAHEFARGPGTPGYAHNTTVDFGGVAAKYVRLTINSNWGSLPTFGLSEVRFYYVPVRAREPKPASAAKGISPDVVLSWRSGREAASHNLYLSTDKQAVVDGRAPTVTPMTTSYAPATLELGATYYWKVVEVNQAASPGTWESDLWSFSTAEYLPIDDFESYTNESPGRLFQTWIDGYGYSADEFFPAGNPGNGTGAGVGHDIWTSGGANYGKTITETTIVHGGKQSMPLYYDNRSVAYSEAERTWKTAQDWTTNGADTLTLYFRGTPIGLLERSPGAIVMNAVGTDIYGTADQGRFVYKQLTGDGTIIARVNSLTNTNTWAKAGVMIRQTLEAGSMWAFALASPANGVHFQARLTNGGGATSDTVLTLPATQTTAQIPLWVKLDRKGDQFNAYYASGETPTTWIANPWNPQTITMTGAVYIGLAVTSHAAGVITQAEFSNVTTTGNVTGQWQSAALGIDQPAGNLPDRLYIAVEDGSGHKATVVNTDPYAVDAGAWTQWNIPLSTLNSAGVKTDSIKKMVIGVGDKTKPASKATGLIYLDDISYGRPAAGQ